MLTKTISPSSPPEPDNVRRMEEHMLQFHQIANITKQMPDQFLLPHVWNQDNKS
jgi:hypothetical protein